MVILNFDGEPVQLTGLVALEFYAEGERGAAMRDRLAQNMPGLVSATQLLDRGAYALIALKEMPLSLAELAQAWSTAGLIGEALLNSPIDGRGNRQESFGARLNPEGAAPDFKVYIGHDPDAFIQDENRVEPLDWRRALHTVPLETPGGTPRPTPPRWTEVLVPVYPPEQQNDKWAEGEARSPEG